jgi:predicted ATPase
VISRIDLRLFKCFELLRLPLGRLTLLSGSNGSGKSSVLQALVLLHQTMREHEWSRRLMLNGDLLRLGTVSDIVDKVHGRGGFEIGILGEEGPLSWSFSGDRAEMSLLVERVVVQGVIHKTPSVLRYLLPPEVDQASAHTRDSLLRLSYLTAERVGPREFYSLEDPQTAPVVGPQGEHAVSVLHLGRDKHVIPKLALPDVPPTRLRQVEERMRRFFPGCAIDVQPVPQANAVTLGLRTSEATSFHRPIHVGFGLTQVFPIVVAALAAEPGDILLIENPEVHLHPAGQAQMGQFLSEVASAGVQVVVETHSDHVLNGIRRSVKGECIESSDVFIHFFRARSDQATQVETPTLDSAGNVDSWPEGFFDQFDKDMNYFAGWS